MVTQFFGDAVTPNVVHRSCLETLFGRKEIIECIVKIVVCVEELIGEDDRARKTLQQRIRW